MSLRRLVSVSSVLIVATASAVVAQPKADKTPAPAPAPAPAGSAAPAEGSAVQPIEDAPPSDMEGRDENPDAPRGTVVVDTTTTAPAPTAPTGYPIELALRPITLPANMAEVSIDPHFRVGKPRMGAAALRGRYGITPKIQLGLTYVVAGIYDDPATDDTIDYGFHPGKAGGLDVTVLLTNWVGVKVGVPVYLDPFAMSLALGAPMKFKLTDKVAIGGMDDVLNIALPVEAEFAPSFYDEGYNAVAAELHESTMGTSAQSRGTLRFSGFGIYQHQPNLAVVGRLAIELEDFSANRGDTGFGGTTTSLHAGAMFSPKPFIDVGGSLGFDDLSTTDSFALSGFLAVRI
jgi:hypothetical protein